MEALKELFNSKAATPFDRHNENGETALHLAAGEGHECVCQLLLEQGADAYALTEDGENPLNYLQWYAADHGDEVSKVMTLFRMFIVKYQGDNLLDFGNRKISWHRFLSSGSEPLTRGMALALEQAYPPYYERPLEMRVEFATWILHPLDRAPDAESLRLAITKGSIDPRCFHIESSTGRDLTTRIIYSMANCVYLNDDNAMSGWSSIMTEAVQSKINLHDVNGSGETALGFFFLFWEECFDGERLRERNLNAAVRNFIRALQNSGVDLLSYGAKEMEIQKKRLHDYRQIAGVDSREPFEGHWFALKYGSSVDDWHMYITYSPHYGCVEEFWNMVENPWERIPGAWVD